MSLVETNDSSKLARDAAVYLATRRDAVQIADSLALAFEDDPVMIFLLPDASSRCRRLTKFFRTALAVHHLTYDTCFTDADRAAAALWNPPDCWHLSPLEILRGSVGFVGAFGSNIVKGLRALGAIEGTHPRTPPHYYLAVLGTRPDRQGKGLGSTVLQPVLERCDREGVGAYLESSKERNIPFYRRHGFEVTGEIKLPGGGPVVWPMWRKPAVRSSAPSLQVRRE